MNVCVEMMEKLSIEIDVKFVMKRSRRREEAGVGQARILIKMYLFFILRNLYSKL